MKRIVSISLTLIMLIAGAHPIVAMHFCNGDLHSVYLAGTDRPTTSCCGNMQGMSQKNSGDKTQSRNTQSSTLDGSGANCCDFKQVEISTDNYNRQVQQSDQRDIQPCLQVAWLFLYSPDIPVEPNHLTDAQHTFPPGGLNKLNQDLLSYICIYRI